MLSHYIARDIFLHQFNLSPGIGLLAIVSARQEMLLLSISISETISH
jgi:hypothetical protein